MTTATDPTAERTWSANTLQVRKAIAFIRSRRKKKQPVNAEDLVAWDLDNGRRLFDWDDETAAAQWRLHQARNFMNQFRGMFEKMRVRAFIHVRKDAEAGIEESSYATVEEIAEHPGMRDQVIADIAKRMRTLASELKMWKLTSSEQAAIFDQLRDAMNAAPKRHAA